MVVIVGLQLIFVLKELRKTIKKIGNFIDEFEKIEKNKDSSLNQKKQIIHKKKVALHSILDKIKILSPTLSSKTKKFFIKEKN